MPSDFADLKTKSRKISTGDRDYRVGTQGGAASSGGAPHYSDLTMDLNGIKSFGSQVTLTDGHPWPPRERSQGDIGGPFRTTKVYVTLSPGGEPLNWDELPERTAQSPNWGGQPVSNIYPTGYSYEARFLPTAFTNLQNYWTGVTDPASSESSLIALGATAIARCKPTNSIANLSVALAEVYRDGLPKRPGVAAWENRANLARGAGDEYLNAVFGWLPLVSDIKAVAKAAANQDKFWRQYQRDAGRVVRRGYGFPSQKTTTLLSTASNRTPAPTTNLFVDKSKGTYTLTRRTTRDVWFSGAFTYYLPKAEDMGAKGKRWFNALQKLRVVYGLTLDPEVVWNLAPWSWAADWFANTGDVLSNISDIMTDGLVMHYGYVMEHVVECDEHSLVGYRPFKGTLDHDLKLYVVRETKQRLRASPYGFGLTWDSFSPRQLAILAALGVTRGDRK